MNFEQDNFDELIRQKFSEKEFMFNEENWEKMESKINRSRNFKRNALWSSIFVIGLFTGIGIMLLFNTNKTPLQIAESNKIQNSITSETSNKNESSENTEIVTINKNSTKNNSITDNDNTIDDAINTNSVDNQKNELALTETKNTTAFNPVKKEKSASNISPVKVTDKESISENSNDKMNEVSSTETKVASENKVEKKENPITEVVKQNDEITSEEITVATIESNEEENKITNKITNDITETENDSSITENEDEDDIVTEKDLEKEQEQIASNDFRNGAPNSSAPSGLASSTFITASLGANYTFGWNTNNGKEANGFNPVAGLGVSHNINPKWTVNIGAQYGSIRNLKNSTKTFTDKNYSFGSTTIDTTITTNCLHYMVIPLLIEYNFNGKNALLFGGNVSYLINSNSKLTVNSSSVGPTPHGSELPNNINNSSVKGYYNSAFNNFDATLSLGYRRRLTDKFSISAYANLGLLDLKENNFFGINKTERNNGLNLVLSYNIFGLK